MQSHKTAISTILLLLIIVINALCVYADGGLECENEPPSPGMTGQSSWVDLPAGFDEISTLNESTINENGADLSLSSTSVDTCNGNVRVSFIVGGQYPAGKPLMFYHNSRSGRRYPMGVGMNHTYNILLLEHGNEWHFDDVRVVLPTGYRLSFDQDIDGSFRGQAGIWSQLTRLESGGYLLYTDGKPDMNSNGNVCHCFGPADESGRCRLVYIKDGDDILYFSYVLSGPAFGEIEKIQDANSGGTVTFCYDSQGRLESVTSLDSVKTGFTYNSSGNISQVTGYQKNLVFDYDLQHNIININDGLDGHNTSFSYGLSARCKDFRGTNGTTWSFSYITDTDDKVLSVSFGPQGTVPSVYEFINRMVVVSSIPGKPTMHYKYSADKRYLDTLEQ